MSIEAKLAALLVLIGLAFGVHWHGVNQGQRLERADWLAKDLDRISSEQKATLKAIENNTRIAQQQEIDKRKVVNDYQKELAAIRIERDRGRTGRLYLPATVCNSVATATKTDDSGGVGAAIAGAVELPEAIERDLRDLVRDADEVTATARAMQESARTSGCYAKMPELSGLSTP